MNITLNMEDAKATLDEFCLSRCLIMAQHSLPPDQYECFESVYNTMIENRGLNLPRIVESSE